MIHSPASVPSQVIPTGDLRVQYLALKPEIDEAVQRVLLSGEFERGEEIDSFEQAYAEFCGTKYAVGVGSGYAAVFLALKASGIGPGDEVITVADTDMATAASISHTGALPVFADVLPRTFNLDPEKIEARITPRTRAIVPVHLYGLPADMDPIMEIGRRHGLLVIEDACLAVGARYQGRRAGSIGDAGCFSFAPHKILGAYGDGGAIVTNNPEIADKCRLWGSYGERRRGRQIGPVRVMEPLNHEVLGYHNHLDTLQAAVLKIKLAHVDEWISKRQEIAGRYGALLADLDLLTPEVPRNTEHTYRSYVLRVKDRDRVRTALAERGISTSIIYSPALHLQPALRHLGYHRGDLPVTEQVADEVLSLPMFADLSSDQVDYVARALHEAMR